MKVRLLLPLLLCMAFRCVLPGGSTPSWIEDHPAPTTATSDPVVVVVTSEIALASSAPMPVPTETPAPTETPMPTPAPTETPVPTETPRFYEKFTDGTPILTEDTYRTESVAIFLSHVEDTSNTFVKGPLVYHVADIYLADATMLRSAFTHEDFRYKYVSPMPELAASSGAILAISGDYIRYRDLGLCMRNGILYRSRPDPKRDAAALYRDGTMAMFDASSTPAQELTADPNIWHLIGFGPSLLDDAGQPKTKFHTTVAGINPRAAIGYYEPGHYCFVLVEGRLNKYSIGLSMEGLSQLMASLGCKSAFNLDGGSTASMYFNGSLLNASTPRGVHDIFYIPLQSAAAPAEETDESIAPVDTAEP